MPDISFISLILVVAGIALVAYGVFFLATTLIDVSRRRDDESVRNAARRAGMRQH